MSIITSGICINQKLSKKIRHLILRDFELQMVQTRMPDLIQIDKKKGICRRVETVVPPDHRVKMKESEKNKISGPCSRVFKKLRNK